MKSIDATYFDQIYEAYRENSASSCNWANARVRELQAHLQAGNKLQIVEHDKTIVIESLQHLIEWKKGKPFESISFEKEIDNMKLIAKTNINIERYTVRRVQISGSINEFSGKTDLHFSLASEDGQSFYTGFKDVVYHQLSLPESLQVKNIQFRMAYLNEVDELKTTGNPNGQVNIAMIYADMKTGQAIKKIIICREVES